MEQLGVISRQDKPTDLVYSLVTVRKPNKIILCIDPKMTWIVRLGEGITTYKQSTKKLKSFRKSNFYAVKRILYVIQ